MVHDSEFQKWGDPKRGKLLRDLGIDASQYGDEDWCLLAADIVRAICRKEAAFTTDKVWFYLDDIGRSFVQEPRAMGWVMREAGRYGWCRATDRTIRSVRAECHNRPVRVWASLLSDCEA